MFKTNYEKVLLEDGTYEFQIIEATYGQATTGSEFINLKLKVREDVEQEHQGFIVEERMWKNNSTGEYNTRRFNNICKSAGIAEGTEFSDEEDFCKSVEGAILKASVVKKFDDYREEDINSIQYYQSTDAPFAQPKPKPKKEKPAPTPKVEVEVEDDEDDDLPW